MSTEGFTLAQLVDEAEWRRCFPDWASSSIEELLEAFAHFCRTYWHVRHPERGRVLFELSEAQLEAAEAFLRERYVIALKARQIGFSTLVAAYAFWATFGYGNRYIPMLSKGEREAKKLLQKATYGYKSLPIWMKHRGPHLPPTGASSEAMKFSNESLIESLPSGSDPARGETAWTVIVDEMAFLPNPDEAWASIEPIADVGGRVIELSTANGVGNIFHTHWVQSKNGGNGTGRFYGIFFPWWACAALDRDQDWYDRKLLDTPEWQMAQEYPDNPEDAFLKSGRPFFSVQVIRKWEPIEPLHVGMLDPDLLEIVDRDDGPLRIWELPIERGRYVIGADVAEGLDHGDFSSAHILNARSRRVVAHWHGHVEVDTFGDEILAPLGLFYNKALLGVENNNMGIATLKALQRVRYPNLYRQRRIQQRNPRETEVLGWKTTAPSKGLMAAELDTEIRAGLECPDAETAGELKTFVREGDTHVKLHAIPPNHDDRVMSLGIAVQMLKHAFLPEYTIEDEPGPGTFAWFIKQSKNRQREAPDRHYIGSHAVRSAA